MTNRFFTATTIRSLGVATIATLSLGAGAAMAQEADAAFLPRDAVARWNAPTMSRVLTTGTFMVRSTQVQVTAPGLAGGSDGGAGR